MLDLILRVRQAMGWKQSQDLVRFLLEKDFSDVDGKNGLKGVVTGK